MPNVSVEISVPDGLEVVRFGKCDASANELVLLADGRVVRFGVGVVVIPASGWTFEYNVADDKFELRRKFSPAKRFEISIESEGQERQFREFVSGFGVAVKEL